MDNDVDSTKERPAIRTRRRRVSSSGTRQASPRSGDGASSARRTSSGTYARRSGDRSRQAGARRQASTQSNRRRAKGTHAATQAAPRRRGIPVLVVLILLVVSVVASVLITRSMLTPQIEEAQGEAAKAKSQVATLTNELERVAGTQKTTSDSSNASNSKDEGKNTDKDTKAAGGVESPWTSSGTYTSGDTVLDGEVKAFCDSIADSSMNREDAMLLVYEGIAWSDYVERDDAQHPAGKDWRAQYARMYYEHDCSGNCYEFAAFLSYCMQYMGYDDAQAEGIIIELESGSWGDHGIVFVTNTDGSKCICDTARGTDGYMISTDAYNYQVQDFENA